MTAMQSFAAIACEIDSKLFFAFINTNANEIRSCFIVSAVKGC